MNHFMLTQKLLFTLCHLQLVSIQIINFFILNFHLTTFHERLYSQPMFPHFVAIRGRSVAPYILSTLFTLMILDLFLDYHQSFKLELHIPFHLLHSLFHTRNVKIQDHQSLCDRYLHLYCWYMTINCLHECFMSL